MHERSRKALVDTFVDCKRIQDESATLVRKAIKYLARLEDDHFSDMREKEQ